jgi:hypothetical protein
MEYDSRLDSYIYFISYFNSVLYHCPGGYTRREAASLCFLLILTYYYHYSEATQDAGAGALWEDC